MIGHVSQKSTDIYAKVDRDLIAATIDNFNNKVMQEGISMLSFEPSKLLKGGEG